MSSTIRPSSTLPLPNSRNQIPHIGFGVYQSPPSTCVNSCIEAIRTGYRHIDTAQYYENESSVAQAIEKANVPRPEIFITTKILVPGNDVESTYKSIEESVKKLDGENGYVDLFLVHSPNGGKESRRRMWLALEKAKSAGKVRDIGVSNYGIAHIEEIKEIGTIWPPAVNQIELHPWCQQREIVEYCRKNDIVIEAYCPLVRNRKAHCQKLTGIANKHQRTTNQILVRYCLQKGWVPLPKSDAPDRIVGNAAVYDFELDREDMATLDSLDQGENGAIVQAVQNS